jgi:hypothetical protein
MRSDDRRIYRPHARAVIAGHIDRSVGAIRDTKGEVATVWTDGRTRSAGHGIDASKNVSAQRGVLRRSGFNRNLTGTGLGAVGATSFSSRASFGRRTRRSIRASRSSSGSRTTAMRDWPSRSVQASHSQTPHKIAVNKLLRVRINSGSEKDFRKRRCVSTNTSLPGRPASPFRSICDERRTPETRAARRRPAG